MNEKQLNKFNKMSYDEKKALAKKLLKQARIFSIATLAGVGLVFTSGVIWISNTLVKRQDMLEFEKTNNIDYQAYVEEVKQEELGNLQASVLSREISFEEYEVAKKNIKSPSETEYLQTLAPSISKEYNKLANNVGIALAGGLVGTMLSSVPAITFAALSDKKSKEYKEYHEMGC